jgi:di/tricarboxylate transporter
MEPSAWLTLLLIVGLVAVLARELMPPSMAVLVAVIVVLAAGIITPSEAFAGFSNPAPITVAALYVVARAVEKTGVLQPVVHAALGDHGGRSSLLRLLAPTAGASAFLNNTPIVAMTAPQVEDWAAARGVSPSLYLMPLSFASIVGGVVTLIGTSTNLVVSGLLVDADLPPLGMFELTAIGLPIAVFGVAMMVAIAPIVLPARRAPREVLSEGARQFVVDMDVIPGGPLDGRTVGAGGLRRLQGVFLIQVDRHGRSIAPVSPDTELQGGDRLRFAGKVDLVVDLQRTPGLVSAERSHVPPFDATRTAFFEAVVGAASPLVGTTLRDAGFRSQYQAAVLAIHRSGERIDEKLGAVRLRVGDTLLLISDAGFRDRWYDRRDFLLVSRLGGTMPVSMRHGWLVGLIGIGMVLVAAAGIVPILQASLVSAVLLVLFGVLTPREARNAIDVDVLILIGASFGIGAAIESSGLAGGIAGSLVSLSAGLGPWALLLGVVIATIVLTEIITNNAAAVLIFPIALAAGHAAGIDPRPLVIGITVAGSASFLTPIGYQTNTMVYGPGGYRFTDYVRLGTPITVGVIAAIMVIVPIVWPL